MYFIQPQNSCIFDFMRIKDTCVTYARFRIRIHFLSYTNYATKVDSIMFNQLYLLHNMPYTLHFNECSVVPSLKHLCVNYFHVMYFMFTKALLFVKNETSSEITSIVIFLWFKKNYNSSAN